MAVCFGVSHTVTIVRDAGKSGEKRWEVQVGGTLDYNILYHPDAGIKRGDQIHTEVFDEPRVVTEVHPQFTFSGLSHYEADIAPLSDFDNSGGVLPAIQVFHGDVGQVIGGDINVNISATILLQALAEAVEKSDLPKGERESIRNKIRELAQNPYVTGIGSSLVTEVLKKFLGM